MATPTTKTDDAIDRIAMVLEQLNRNAPINEIGFGDPRYQDRLKEEGFFDTFPTPIYQNGHLAEARGIPQAIREKASALKPGTFLNGKVSVDVSTRGEVFLRYAAQTVEDRMRFQTIAPTFEVLIEKLWAEQHPQG